MKTLGWSVTAVCAALLYYIYKTPASAAYNSGPAGIDDAADNIGNWGGKQRLKGTGGQALGKLKEGFGRVTGDDETASEGVADQAVGSVKDAAGKVAGAVEDTIHDLNK